MRPFDIVHGDPAIRARVAALRSGREVDPRTRERARAQTPTTRLRDGFALARFARQLRGRAS